LSILLLAFLLIKVSFGIECIALNFHGSLFMKLDELFLMIKDFFKEFFASGASPVLLSTPHLLLEPIQSLGLLLALGKHFGASVEISINQLSLKKYITLALGEELAIAL